MYKKYLGMLASPALIVMLTFIIPFKSLNCQQEKLKPRVLVSSDIGGSDPDDFQSMIHFLMYADLFHIEGLVASPWDKGRKKDILDIIDLYEKDFSKLKAHSSGFPDPDSLRAVCKQGGIPSAAFKGFITPSEGSDWIIKCAKKPSNQPLWILVWGGLEDLAQALHDAPEIKKNIKVYWIGGPNKKFSTNAYAYIAKNHPDLWIIEDNASYRGLRIDIGSPKKMTEKAYYRHYIKGYGALGKAFKNYDRGEIVMGDTPSVAYMMNGNQDDPTGESWGGSFTRIDRSSRFVFDRNTTTADTVTTYAVLEWRFKGPELDIPEDSSCFTMEIWKQVWPGYYLGNGIYSVRYASKKPETATYVTSSSIPELNGLTGQYVSINPFPGKPDPTDYKLGANWFSDRQEPELYIGVQQGAKTVGKYREAFLMDWAKRWKWLK